MNPQNRTIAVIGLGYVRLPLGAGEEGGTDRQRVLHAVIASRPAGGVAIHCALLQCKRITAQRGFAVGCGPPRRTFGASSLGPPNNCTTPNVDSCYTRSALNVIVYLY
jgi:hypothetical protein